MHSKNSSFALISLFIFQSALWAISSSSINTRQEQEAYLRQFAYMGSDSRDPRIGELTNTEDIFRLAVRKFQAMAGLTPTGTVDAATQRMMEMPRCGVADEVGLETSLRARTRTRKRRYTAQGSKWNATTLTYRINNFTPDLPRNIVESEIQTALNRWSDVTPLRFQKVATTDPRRVDIDIKFARKDHGDGASFDGKGKTLAHAFFPQFGGDAHFDEDEDWTYQSYSGTNLLQVAIHEFGHAFGLGHSDVNDSIMAPFYRGYVPNVKLHKDDIQGINYIYGSLGRRSGQIESTTRVTRLTQPTQPPQPPRSTPVALCKNPVVDAFFAAGGELHLFQGSQYYKLDFNGVLYGYPKPIRQVWSGLPDSIDTAFHADNSIYLFKGTQVWKYDASTRQLDSAYPQLISNRFKGVPNDLDAAFIWSGNGKLFFIKGNQTYRLSYFRSPWISRVDATYPSKLEYWKGLPAKIDVAFNLGNSRTYFFSGKDYYRFNDVLFRVDDGYPKITSSFWFNCPNDPHPGVMKTEWSQGNDQFIPGSRTFAGQGSSAGQGHLLPPLGLGLIATVLLTLFTLRFA